MRVLNRRVERLERQRREIAIEVIPDDTEPPEVCVSMPNRLVIFVHESDARL